MAMDFWVMGDGGGSEATIVSKEWSEPENAPFFSSPGNTVKGMSGSVADETCVSLVRVDMEQNDPSDCDASPPCAVLTDIRVRRADEPF